MSHRKTSHKKGHWVLTLGLSLALVGMVAVYFAFPVLSRCRYTIIDGENIIEITSSAASTEAVLEEAGLSLGAGDRFTTEGGSTRRSINIARCQNITVNNAGEALSATVYGGTVGDLLDQLAISLCSGDTLTVRIGFLPSFAGLTPWILHKGAQHLRRGTWNTAPAKCYLFPYNASNSVSFRTKTTDFVKKITILDLVKHRYYNDLTIHISMEIPPK